VATILRQIETNFFKKIVGTYFFTFKLNVMAKEPYIPQGYHNVTPSLTFKGTEEAIVWYKNVFGAKEKMKLDGPDKKIMHAELTIGDSMIFLAEENPQNKNKTPKSTNGNSISLHLYVEDVDATIKKAVQNGATLTMPSMDMFYGDRCGCIDDPFGYTWLLATHVKDVPEKEVRKKAEEMTPEHA
jgi:PhnB protein